jgi:hypothetical protein
MGNQCRGLIDSCSDDKKPVMPLLGIEVIDSTGHVIKSYDISPFKVIQDIVK